MLRDGPGILQAGENELGMLIESSMDWTEDAATKDGDRAGRQTRDSFEWFRVWPCLDTNWQNLHHSP